MNSLTDTTEFDRFFTAYVRAALWSSTDDEGEPLDGYCTALDLAPATRETMLQDCAKFYRENVGRFILVIEGIETHEEDSAGHDFWLTRNRHGSGFWDMPDKYGDVNAELLTNAAHEFGEVSLYVGEDGLIYQCTG